MAIESDSPIEALLQEIMETNKWLWRPPQKRSDLSED